MPQSAFSFTGGQPSWILAVCRQGHHSNVQAEKKDSTSKMIDFDFHTHRLDTPPGKGIVCLPQHIVRAAADTWLPAPGGCYAAGIHPWWTADADFHLAAYMDALARLLQHPEVVQVGECGIDRLQGAGVELQYAVFQAQVELSEAFARPMTLHCVRAFDLILHARKSMRPVQVWTVHGFRGHATLARQLLDAGIDLSFGERYDEEAWRITPEGRRHRETDAE